MCGERRVKTYLLSLRVRSEQGLWSFGTIRGVGSLASFVVTVAGLGLRYRNLALFPLHMLGNPCYSVSARTMSASSSVVRLGHGVPSDVVRAVRIRPGRQGDREALLASLLIRSFKERVMAFVQTKRQTHRLHIVLGLLGIRVCGSD